MAPSVDVSRSRIREPYDALTATRSACATHRPSGLMAGESSNRAAAFGVRSTRPSAWSIRALSTSTGDVVASSRGKLGPRSESQYRTGYDSCRIAVTPASSRALRCCSSCSPNSA